MGLSLEHTSFARYYKELGLAEGLEKALKESVQKLYAKIYHLSKLKIFWESLLTE